MTIQPRREFTASIRVSPLTQQIIYITTVKHALLLFKWGYNARETKILDELRRGLSLDVVHHEDKPLTFKK